MCFLKTDTEAMLEFWVNNLSTLQKIRQLLFLMEAESADVRRLVSLELSGLVSDIEALLADDQWVFPPEQLFWLQEVVANQKRNQKRQGWLGWLEHSDPYRQLETGFSLLAQFQTDLTASVPLPLLLDELCDQYLAIEPNPNVFSLNRFLFKDGLLQGAQKNYYHPKHSHLPSVIQDGQGLPLSLAVIFMLVGYRIDLEIVGFNLPGHFLSRALENEELFIFDCFNQGKVLKRHELFSLAVASQIQFDELLNTPLSPAEIIMRALSNLIHAYRHSGQQQQRAFMQDLLADLYKRVSKPQSQEEHRILQEPKLCCGQLVKHRKYGYRGVVVDFDLNCQASDSWYRNNLSHPDKNQPWYHVLVDSSEATTYAAESSLEADPRGKEISHPLLAVYFDRFEKGKYLRNQVPWSIDRS